MPASLRVAVWFASRDCADQFGMFGCPVTTPLEAWDYLEAMTPWVLRRVTKT